ncbi:MAG: sigma 54-interacting transcriptional regulator [Deferrisomatales bacterium]
MVDSLSTALAALAAVDAGVLVLDAGGRVRHLTPRAGKLLGAEPAQWLGRPVAGLLPEARDPVAACLGTGATQPPFGARCADRPLQAVVAPVAAGAESAGAVLTLREAPPGGASGPGTQAALHQELLTVFNLSHDGLWIIDGDGYIVNLNAAAERLNRVRAADLVGKHVDELVSEGIIDTSVSREVMRTRQPVSLVQYARRSRRHILVTGTPSFDEAGELSFIVVNDRDITELTALSQQLEEAKRVNAKYQEELATLSALAAPDGDTVAESPAMKEVFRVALKLARMGVSNILVLGESGTGKGQLARFIHSNSRRKKRPFVQINCAALPESLLEAELFGYEKGAFTGAKDEGKAGLVELAEGGTLFLDEIGDMPFSIQAKLLKYLDDHEIRRLGSTKTKVVECAVVAATNQDLWTLVEQKRFRHDLYYRLNTFTLRLAPLRDREADILPLAHHFLDRYNRVYGTRKRLSHGAAECLRRYPFPGNVRELESIIKNAVVMSESDVLDDYIASVARPPGTPPETSGAAKPSRRDLAAELDAVEKRLLLEAAALCRTTREMAAYLSTSQASVVRKLRKHGLSAPSARPGRAAAPAGEDPA